MTEKPSKTEKVAPVAAAPVETTTEATSTDLPAGAAAALENGEAPEGFEIKGNAGSMKYHVPGSRWYSNTQAEIWFDTKESAEAAGYAPAGGAAAQTISED